MTLEKCNLLDVCLLFYIGSEKGKNMLNTIYRLVAPRRFEIAFQEIDLSTDRVIVRPDYLSICHADQRYYQGVRPAQVMKKKLPMALIHEGVGHVVFDPSGTYHAGAPVIMIPNTPTQEDDVIAENYRFSSRFRGSGYDGFMQEYVSMTVDRIVPLSLPISLSLAAFTELVSVSVHALRRFHQLAHQRREKVGIWGDGNLGYITAVLFHAMFPDTKLYVFGVTEEKLSAFSFADEVHQVMDIPEELFVDHAIECVGGAASQHAIAQMISHISPEGTIALLGVSEYPVPIETRMILEKGLRLYGSSRSGREDFLETVSLYQHHPEVVSALSNLIGKVISVQNMDDMKRAFEWDIQKERGKTIMKWLS
jgi:ribitol-5-phosphate 2-dehydrogenase